MADFLASTSFIDLVLCMVAVEWGVIALYRRRTGRGLRPLDLGLTLLSGAALLLALRFAVAGHGGPAVAGALTLALCAHLADISRRWRG